MCERVIHRRSFNEESLYSIEKSLQFDTAVDVFKVIHVGSYNGLPTVWYETLESPIHRRQVTLKSILDGEHIPNNSVHVGSVMYGSMMVHIYQVFDRK